MESPAVTTRGRHPFDLTAHGRNALNDVLTLAPGVVLAGRAQSRGHGTAGSHEGSALKWVMQHDKERRGILARYGIAALLPTEAVLFGRKAVFAEHPSTPRRSRPSLLERADRVGGQNASG